MGEKEGIKRVWPVELRRSAEMANAMIKTGLPFICMPYETTEEKDALLAQVYARLDRMAADSEVAE